MAGQTKPKNKQERRAMKTGGRILGEILAATYERVQPGITTAELNRFVKEKMEEYRVEPAFLGYYGFPGHACMSVNEELIHGIPGDTELKDGDLFSIDCGLIYDGMALDSARTIPVGTISEEAHRLLEVTNSSLHEGLHVLRAGESIGTYGAVVEAYVLEHGLGLVRDYCGHGIGDSVHETPNIPNYGERDKGMQLEEHMTVALEPMVTAGRAEVVVENDDWTVRTKDRSLSAHVEHTVLITKQGAEILTTA
jgi:methionyl aminopeptidase